MDFEKSQNSLRQKKMIIYFRTWSDYLLKNFFYHFFNTFLELSLYEINFIDIFNMVNFFKIFGVSWNTAILIILIIIKSDKSAIKYSRILYVYTPSQKFNTIRILELLDIIKIWKKSTILKMSKTFILHNNKAEKLLSNRQKNNCPIKNQVTYTFFF